MHLSHFSPIKNNKFGGTWVAESVKQPALAFRSGYNLRVVRSGSALGVELAKDSLSPSSPIPTPPKKEKFEGLENR